MTTQDKTGQKLVDSIRKTKAGATATPSQPEKPATKPKAPARRRPAPKTQRSEDNANRDPYQSGARVWPD